MNTTYEQISFIAAEQKQDERKNTLRMRERLMIEHGFDAFDDTDILTTVLSYAKGPKDTAGLVNRLFDTFGSLKAILEARPEQLLSVDGMTLSRASMISLVVPLTRVWHEFGINGYLFRAFTRMVPMAPSRPRKIRPSHRAGLVESPVFGTGL